MPFRLYLWALVSGIVSATAFAETGEPAEEHEAEPATAAAQTGSTAAVAKPALAKDLLSLPVSVTVADAAFLDQGAIRTVKAAAIHAPNTYFANSTGRRASIPYFRGIGGSLINPGVTVFYDGVPQLHSHSSSVELLDIDQIAFVRGPQGTLFGRNTIGGAIDIRSRRPSLDGWQGEYETTVGNYNLLDMRWRVSGPLIQDQLGFSFAGGFQERDGYTTNAITGNDLDDLHSYFGKAQLLWSPAQEIEVRLIVAAESASEGGHGFYDVAALRGRQRFSEEGWTERDVIMPTLQVIYHHDAFDLTATTGLVWWETVDSKTFFFVRGPPPAAYQNDRMTAWTQEFHFANPAGDPVVLTESLSFSWQAGLFAFLADSTQHAIDRGINSTARLIDRGIGAYAQGTLSLWKRLDLTAGFRIDYEEKEATIRDPYNPPPFRLFLPTEDRVFTQISPTAAASYAITPGLQTYFRFASGYRAGGFNLSGPLVYKEEESFSYEVGLKGKALDGNLLFAIAAFYTDWDNVQLNHPLGIFESYIDNTGDALSRGIELESSYRIHPHASLFGSASWLQSEFKSNSMTDRQKVAGNTLPYAPGYTFSLGGQFEAPVCAGLDGYARIDAQMVGPFGYDARDLGDQEAYTLLNFRLGVRSKRGWFAEGYVNNALDADYVPIAFAYPGPRSPLSGQTGPPITFGLRAGIRF